MTEEKISEEEAGDIADGRLIELYTLYQERLKILNAADFGDLLLHCLTIFATKKNEKFSEIRRARALSNHWTVDTPWSNIANCP